jgi:hypothetical protein
LLLVGATSCPAPSEKVTLPASGLSPFAPFQAWARGRAKRLDHDCRKIRIDIVIAMRQAVKRNEAAVVTEAMLTSFSLGISESEMSLELRLLFQAESTFNGVNVLNKLLCG